MAQRALGIEGARSIGGAAGSAVLLCFGTSAGVA